MLGLSCQVLDFFKKIFFYLACGIQFPKQALDPGPLHWEHAALATGSPGKSLDILYFIVSGFFCGDGRWTQEHLLN